MDITILCGLEFYDCLCTSLHLRIPYVLYNVKNRFYLVNYYLLMYLFGKCVRLNDPHVIIFWGEKKQKCILSDFLF